MQTTKTIGESLAEMLARGRAGRKAPAHPGGQPRRPVKHSVSRAAVNEVLGFMRGILRAPFAAKLQSDLSRAQLSEMAGAVHLENAERELARIRAELTGAQSTPSVRNLAAAQRLQLELIDAEADVRRRRKAQEALELARLRVETELRAYSGALPA